MRKVLFVDTWSKGRFFTDTTAQIFKEAGYQVDYLHADNFYGIVDGVHSLGPYDSFTDLDSYNMSIVKAMADIKPDIVIFISMHGVFHRWVNLICEKLSIPTLFYMHGVRFESKQIGSSRKKTVKELLSRGVFYSRHWWLCMRDNLRLTSVFNLPWGGFLSSYLEMILQNRQFSFSPRVKWGLKFETVCINTEDDKQFFSKFIGEYRPKEFVISGNMSSRRAALNSLKIRNKKKEKILFISQPLISAGYIDLDTYIQSIKILDSFFSKNHYGKLEVRFHPRDDESFKQAVIDMGICCSINEDFAEDLAETSLVIGFNSSALLGCTDIGMPVVGFEFGNIPLLSCLNRSECYTELNFIDESCDTELSAFISTVANIKRNFTRIEYSEDIIISHADKIIGDWLK